jgi:short-subunit dehydrogenase
MAMQKKVLITGAGSGIGKEFVKLFLTDGSHVLGVSLLDEELTQLVAELDPAGKSLQTLQLDVSLPEAAETMMKWCTENDWMPDVVINNAGFACFGDAVDLSPERVSSMLALNVVSLTSSSMIFGKMMKERRSGAILNVGSTAGMIPSVRMASYGGSKSYVNTFTYALAAELKPFGVSVTCLTPGATQTKFAEAGGIDTFTEKSLLHNMFEKKKAGSPATVAKAGYDAIARKRPQALVGKGSTFAAILSRAVSQKRLPNLIKNP